ncbi:F-box protein At3g07870-like [Papaver somniferum]|uniref:F-box protein At3g07870-like n=1 Tax=Papaver somniferum TaxID=3469 RepID=UPI000E6F50EA|nr:F-box protein At3g07870-like [Papaver somniferum]
MEDDMKGGLFFSIGDDLASSTQLYYRDIDDEEGKNSTRFSLDTLTKIDHPPVNINDHLSSPSMVGSCNGLVCIYDTRNRICDPIYICNPISGEYVNLPRLGEKPYQTLDHTVSGFGYHQSTHEYKVVRIFYHYEEQGVQVDVQVYTLGDNRGWRNKQVTTRYSLGSSPGIFVYEALHWKDASKKQVVAFDLGLRNSKLSQDPLVCQPVGVSRC